MYLYPETFMNSPAEEIIFLLRYVSCIQKTSCALSTGNTHPSALCSAQSLRLNSVLRLVIFSSTDH